MAEETTTRPDKLPSAGIHPGATVGTEAVTGPSLRGEVRPPTGEAMRARVYQLSRTVRKEPLPQAYREQVERFHDLLLAGGKREPVSPSARDVPPDGGRDGDDGPGPR